MKTVAAATLGCKVNRCDTERIVELFEAAGYQKASLGGTVDVTVVNTCTVTARTDRQNRQLVRRARRMSPETILIVTGCAVDRDPQTFLEMEGVDYVIGNACKQDLATLLGDGLERQESPRLLLADIGLQTKVLATGISRFRDRSRALVKVQDGCDSRCAYCIVPSVRGRSRSVPPDEVIEQVRVLAEAGHGEVVFSGIHLGAYGRDLGNGSTLARLVQRTESQTPVPRIRLSSIEPLEIDEELISLMEAGGPVCPHLHIPLQSGDADVLARMNRNYTPDQYASLVRKLSARVPDLCLGGDVLVGFPGETEQQHQNTVELIEDLPLSYLHVFPFSPRQGTPAATMSGRVPDREVRERAGRLRELGAKKRATFYGRFLGRAMGVICEGGVRDRPGAIRGRTRNYIPVHFFGTDAQNGGEIEVRIEKVEGLEVWGRTTDSQSE